MVHPPVSWCFPDQKLFTTLNTHTCEIVKRAFQDNHKGSVKLSDSQVTLYWINNEKKPTEAVGEKQGSGNKQIYSAKRLDVKTLHPWMFS